MLLLKLIGHEHGQRGMGGGGGRGCRARGWKIEGKERREMRRDSRTRGQNVRSASNHPPYGPDGCSFAQAVWAAHSNRGQGSLQHGKSAYLS